MSEIIFVVEEAAEGGTTARSLGASIFAEADTLAALHEDASLTYGICAGSFLG